MPPQNTYGRPGQPSPQRPAYNPYPPSGMAPPQRPSYLAGRPQMPPTRPYPPNQPNQQNQWARPNRPPVPGPKLVRPAGPPRPPMPPTVGRAIAKVPSFNRPHPSRLKIAAILAGCIIVFGGLFAWMASQRASPDDLFELAMTNMMSTKSYTQKIVTNKDSYLIKADVADIRQPRVSAEFDLRSTNTSISGYATNRDSLIRFGSYGVPTRGVNIAKIKGKWVQLKKDGQPAETSPAGLGFAPLFDPGVAVLGELVIGNFAPPSRHSLIEIIKHDGVYSYDSKKVQEADVDGHPALKYSVTIKNVALKKLNQKVAELAGIKQQTVDDILKSEVGSKDLPVIMYIGTDNQRVLKVETTVDHKLATTTFTDYDMTSLDNAPQAEVRAPDILDR